MYNIGTKLVYYFNSLSVGPKVLVSLEEWLRAPEININFLQMLDFVKSFVAKFSFNFIVFSRNNFQRFIDRDESFILEILKCGIYSYAPS